MSSENDSQSKVDLLALRSHYVAMRNEADEAIKAVDLLLAMPIPRANESVQVDVPTFAPGMPTEKLFRSVLIPPRVPDGLTDAVRESIKALKLVQNDFTVRDVEAQIGTTPFKLPTEDTRTRIAMVLQKLTQRGEIECTVKGSGRIPNRYKVADL